MLLADRYRTTEILGHGGMGEVYRGCDELLGRPVAVKLLRPDLSDPFAAARFRREARAAAVVKDPHVVAVYDFGHSNGEYFLVMELMEGRSVAHELALHGPLHPDRALGVVRQVAGGLAAAHRHDIVHRDIKPDNLLVDVDGSVKIADFGIARSPADPATTSGLILGTSHYLAPERALGHPATPASDVYALGCVLYQLLTGRPPFEGDDPTVVMSRHVEAAPVIPDDVPLGVALLLRRMLAKEPGDRPTADEVATLTTETAAEAPTAEFAVLRPRRNWRSAFAVLASMLVAGTAVTAGVLADQQPNEPVAPPNIAPSQPVQQVRPPARPATVPTAPTVRTGPTVTVTKSAPVRTRTVEPPTASRTSQPQTTDQSGKPGKSKAKKSGRN
ncbi:protein kinase [Kribbella sp. HUAS MG21]|uniref:non-specific serine/threonine protein kinase n=1 Tax=Kribbella sp. HUAS MG21 TaxID=3160966 RepID=A0AAU7TGE7_9ACTN